ncbi:DUF2235 domain-containing protein [uncultured Aquimarina sp.]|uniref:T6SS phospholipase effector Tle1-like catalytic domain-containing protein n=1 Tax=uncultured Aquimarina sp. TaxID=575652 RepID=UPI002630CC5B|nr:DUF2235 domain-containing protein [uncultured Aquimarina sp.]
MGSIGLTAAASGAQETSKNVLSGVNVQTAPVHVGNAEYDELTPEDSADIIVGIFFDGTLNNRANTRARLEYTNKTNRQPYDRNSADGYTNWIGIKRTGSYDNDYSNVSRMEPAYEKINEEKKHQLSIYIEGIGTEDHEGDSTWGKSMGKGATGVKGKVKKGCEEIAKLINELGVEKINSIQIDAYGFSRGAAAARNFVFEINQRKGDRKEILMDGLYQYTGQLYQEDGGVLGEKLKELGLETRLKPQARFVGLYDTVASFGVYHQNDVEQLNLDAIKKARFTFQLAANDEHRSNFMLTKIGSARGKEKYLPGVHSDIGGGYTDNADEEVTLDYGGYLPKLEEERTRLIQQGWYLDDLRQIWVDDVWGTLKAKRTGISNKYSYIPLHIMVEYSIKKKLEYDKNLIIEDYPIIDDASKRVKLTDVKKRLDQYVNDQNEELAFTSPADEEMLKALRNEYFHFSAHYNDRVLGVVPPMKPNRENGVRTRGTLEGNLND